MGILEKDQSADAYKDAQAYPSLNFITSRGEILCERVRICDN